MSFLKQFGGKPTRAHKARYAQSPQQHTWTEPGDEFVAAAQAKGMDYALPRLGELFSIATERREKWWTNEK